MPTDDGFKDIPLNLAGFTLGDETRGPTFSIHHAEQSNYLNKTMYQVQTGLPVNDNLLVFDAQYHQQKGGRYYVDPSHKTHLFALNMFAMIGDNFEGFAAYSQTGSKAYDHWFASDMFGYSNMTTSIWNDFTHANMKAVGAGGFYNLSDFGAKNLTLLALGSYGWNGEVMDFPTGGLMPLTKDTAWEMAAGFTYEVFNGPLQGLWLNATYNRDGGGYSNHSGGRIILDYTVRLF